MFPTLLLVLLGGYLFFNRAFAWIHIPGIPVFAGELVLLVGAYEAWRWGSAAAVVRRSASLKVLVAFMALGFAGFVWGFPRYGLDAVRDSAIWYYGAYAVLVAVALAADPGLHGRLLGAYRRVLPWFLLWSPLAVVLGRGLVDGPRVPDSDTSIFAFKAGDIAVHAALAVAFLWLADERPPGRISPRLQALTALGLSAVLFAGSQNRGGLLAAVTILLLAMVVLRQRGRLAYAFVFTVGILLVVALALDLRVDLGDRELSAQQIFANAQSVLGGSPEQSDLTGTVAWRLELWDAVVDDVVSGDESLFVAGWGFGPNLGEQYGVETNLEQPLRNPHNSHLTVLARMGVAGAMLWLLLWIVWFGSVASRVTPRHDVLPGSPAAQGAWVLAGVAGMLVNAVFDPTLEGPQVAVWFWVLMGFGAALAARTVRPRRARPAWSS